jgi:hypothetical protein
MLISLFRPILLFLGFLKLVDLARHSSTSAPQNADADSE